MSQRNQTYSKWDDLCKVLQPIQQKYAEAAIAAVRQHLGDAVTDDAGVRYAAITCLDPSYALALQLARTDKKVSN